MTRRRLAAALAGVAVSAAAALVAVPHPALTPATRFYVPQLPGGARQQISELTARGATRDAGLVEAMARSPQAIWLTGGSPRQVRADVARTVARAVALGEVPAFVLYALPHRACDGTTSPGAGSDGAYRAWVDGFAAGLARARTVIVIVEPDALAELPADCPAGRSGGAAHVQALTRARFADLAYAVRRTQQRHPAALVYLDAGHPGWRPAPDMAARLHRAGVERARGFALNVANYQRVAAAESYGTAISRCLAYAQRAAPSDFTGCDRPAAEGAGSRADQVAAATPFVVDTSRSGTGPWTPATPSGYADPQVWCNAPGAGLGPRPAPVPAGTAGLVDAYLWVKTPGESDGTCTRGQGAPLGARGAGTGSAAGTATDPVWAARTGRPGFADPPAGAWFPEQALELARRANPPLQVGARH